MGSQNLFFRRLNALGFLLSLASLLSIFSIQHLTGITTFQSHAGLLLILTLLSCGSVFLAALLHNPATTGQRLYALVTTAVFSIYITVVALQLSQAYASNNPESDLCKQLAEVTLTHHAALTDKLSALFHTAVSCPGEIIPVVQVNLPMIGLLFVLPLLLISWKIVIYRPRTESLFQ
ncbi:hypothetical protein [uncultured Neptuniibacter sp.]|uniref:hypothetical protein n=1 Tax=uncultured Neptuniibacter sp. TaxID=502143 RepID=UPI002610D3AF|nr:hypothetical protein [uncultured Neptuniibacter sp.]